MPTVKQDKTKIVQIWGEILDEGFTSVPNILLRYRSKIGLKPKHIMLIIDIMSYKWDTGAPFPSYSTLAVKSGVEERSVKRITQDLEELGLLVKTPRFDEETGAQVTTVFDFRPLVQKLIEEINTEKQKSPDGFEEVDYVNHENIGLKKKIKTNKGVGGYDKNVMGEGDKNVTGGVTELSLGGVTKMSPKEYKYNKKNLYILTQEKGLTYGEDEGYDKNVTKKEKNGVIKNLREGIFRNRIFEMYDNLMDIKSIEDLVEEGAHRACKDIVVNKTVDIKKTKINPLRIAKKIKQDFPYDDLPKNKTKARNFYTAVVCDMVAEAITRDVNTKSKNN